MAPVVFAVGLASAWCAGAQDLKPNAADNTRGFYVNAGGGVSIMRNPVSEGSVSGYEVGPRMDLSVGYDVTQNIAVELQSGFAHNSWPGVNRVVIGGPGDPGSPPIAFGVSGSSTDIWTVPVMVNGIYECALSDHWQVYGGLGAGVLISTLQRRNQDFAPFNSNFTDCDFGYQAMAGIKFRFNDHLETALGYAFLGSLDHHWNGNSGDFRSNATYMHSILLSLTCRF